MAVDIDLDVSDSDERTDTKSTLVEDVLEFLTLTETAEEKQREREAGDLRFQIPEVKYQWDKEAIAMRSAQTVDGVKIPGRAMLCVSTLDEPIQLELNQQAAAQLGVVIHPLTEDATDETAQTLQGLYRHIERTSRAHIARGWAFDRGVKAGRGGYRVITEYDPFGEPGDQRILIKRVKYQDSLRFDPFAEEPDKSDALRGAVLQRIPWKEYKRRYPNSKLAQYSDSEFEGITDDFPEWAKSGEDGAETVIVCEYYWIDITETTMTVTNWKGESVEVPDVRNSRTLYRCVVNPIEELEPKAKQNGRYIPLIPYIGRELQPVDGEQFFMGMIHPAKDGARLTNYSASNAVQMAALEPLAPWIMAEGQAEGHPEWDKSNTVQYPKLEYRTQDLTGRPAGPPQRVQVDVSRLSPSLELLRMGRDFVQTATAKFGPALGQQTPAHRSGRAIQALQDQSVQASSNYLDNLVQITMPYEATVVLDLIPDIYDRPGRVATILDENDKPSQVMLNAPFQMQGNRPVPMPNATPADIADPNHPAQMFDLKKGRYGVSITVGKKTASRLQEGADAIGAIIEADPQILPLIGPEWIKFQDFPGKEALERILRKNRDHQFPWLSDAPDAQMPQQLQQAQQQIQMLTQQLQQMQQDADKNRAMLAGKQIDADTKKQITAVQEQGESERAALDREVKLAVAELSAKVERMSLFMEERARLGDQQHEAAMSQQDRAHEAMMGQQEHAQSLEQSDADHMESLDAAAQQTAMQPQEPEAEGA